MRANEFVKKFGWDWAKSVVKNQPKTDAQIFNPYNQKYSSSYTIKRGVSVAHLKRLVESHELTFLFGDDISYAKKYLKEMLFKFREDMEFYVEDDCRSYSLLELKQAIADVESCMGEG